MITLDRDSSPNVSIPKGPSVVLSAWSIYEAPNGALHALGVAVRPGEQGRISAPLLHLDIPNRVAVSSSGRTYRLLDRRARMKPILDAGAALQSMEHEYGAPLSEVCNFLSPSAAIHSVSLVASRLDGALVLLRQRTDEPDSGFKARKEAFLDAHPDAVAPSLPTFERGQEPVVEGLWSFHAWMMWRQPRLTVGQVGWLQEDIERARAVADEIATVIDGEPEAALSLNFADDADGRRVETDLERGVSKPLDAELRAVVDGINAGLSPNFAPRI